MFWKKTREYISVVESETGDLYKQLGHHGPAVENKWVAYRIYFNSSMSVDLLSKFVPRLELKRRKWSGDETIYDPNDGKYNFKVGKTVGIGGLRLWHNNIVVPFQTTIKRTGEVLQTDSSASILITSLGIPYGEKMIDVEMKLTVYESSRHACIEAKVLSNMQVQFVTGLVTHDKLKTRYLPNDQAYQRMNTSELRENFLVDDLFKPGELKLLYADVDRAIVGSAVPLEQDLILKGSIQEMATEVFAERREIGVINIGNTGSITVDDASYTLEHGDALYIGKGSVKIEFSCNDTGNPAEYYILSFPAHASYPTTLIKNSEGEVAELGESGSANMRKITKLIHPGRLDTCQIVMGITSLGEGQVWNTMPPHLHPRRMEIYLYYALEADQRAFHFMGKPDEIRTLTMRNKEAVISPSWSMHSAAGTSNYTFIWGMGGENQAFTDMDFIDMETLR